MNKPRLMIFCKAPIPGQVKTRLIPSLGEEEACNLHMALATKRITDCLSTEVKARADVELWCALEIDHPFFKAFDAKKVLQEGDDLGQKMANAFRFSNQSGILIGTDCPNLSVDYLLNAIEKLSKHEAVIGPAEDGGYGLIGLNKPNDAVFNGIRWGTSAVCAETCKKFNQYFDNWGLLPLLWDVDREEDIARYQQFVSSD